MLTGLVLLAAQEAAGGRSTVSDPIRLQAEARATATIAAAQEAGADALVDAMRQTTAEAQRAAQAEIAAMVAMETIEAGRDQATSTAEALRDQATSTAEAGRDQTTATAQAQATSTAVAIIKTAVALQPTETVVAANASAYVAQKDWERRMAPYRAIGEAVFWSALGLFFVLACLWVFPRAWVAIQTRFLRVDNEADGVKWMFVGAGVVDAWRGKFKFTPYDHDRDRGPGQTIDPHRPDGLLPGSDPRVTERDQAVQALTRPVLAAGGGNGTSPRRRNFPVRTTLAPLAARPGPSRSYRVLQPGAALPAPVQRVLDNAVIASLDRDWEVG